MISIVRTLFIFICLLSWSAVSGQFSGSNLMEAQYGKLPDEAADPFPSIYNRTILKYRLGKFRLSGTLEQYYTEIDDRTYLSPNQFSIQYKHKNWDIKLGTLYETLGRGFLLRSFEINGAIIEDQGFRSRTYFQRDILGASIKYKSKKWTIHAMRGEVLNNLLPPIFDREDRRTDSYYSLAAKYKYYKRHKAEVILFNYQNPISDANNFISTALEGPFFGNMDYFLAYTTSVNKSDQYTLYAAVTGFIGDLSYNLEYKDYKNFVLGAGINEPPPAVMQQTYRTLNRSIHVSNPIDERGYQIELAYTIGDGSLLTFNHALATNEFGGNALTFQQYFLELTSSFAKVVDFKYFIDLSIDDIKAETNRWSTGLYSDVKMSKDIRFLPEFEFQRFDRDDDVVYNQYYSLGISYKSKLTLNLQLETTTDPFLIRPDESTRLYPGAYLRYQLNPKNTVQFFGGTRRGGPACSAGVCYEILDFQGAEVRWTTRW